MRQYLARVLILLSVFLSIQSMADHPLHRAETKYGPEIRPRTDERYIELPSRFGQTIVRNTPFAWTVSYAAFLRDRRQEGTGNFRLSQSERETVGALIDFLFDEIIEPARSPNQRRVQASRIQWFIHRLQQFQLDTRNIRDSGDMQMALTHSIEELRRLLR